MFVALTSRIRLNSTSEKAIEVLRESRPAVYTFWYDQIFFLIYFFSSRKMPILMTPKGKTDLITALSLKMGLRVAKGSLEGGGRHALVILLDQLKGGQAVAVSASGPYG